MQLVMAVSKDGFIAKNDHDDMSWTGPYDKEIFYALTIAGNKESRYCGVSEKSMQYMPSTLQGRLLMQLSTKGVTLKRFAELCPYGTLLGGPTLAYKAIEMGILDTIQICKSSVDLLHGLPNKLEANMLSANEKGSNWHKATSRYLFYNNLTLETWQNGD